jgi:hypothetical protein
MKIGRSRQAVNSAIGGVKRLVAPPLSRPERDDAALLGHFGA